MSDITFHKLYMYDHVRQLLAVGDNICPIMDNGPMSKDTILAHKGIDNRLHFRVLQPDRRPYDISCNQQVYARIIDPENNAVVLEKLCRLGPAKGMIALDLNSGDIADIHAGLFNLVLIRTEEFIANVAGQYIEKPLYTDMSSNISMQLEITEQALKTALPSTTILPVNWTPDVLTLPSNAIRNCFYSPRIPGSRLMNHKDAVHSFSTYTNNFTGVLELWGTLEETPDAYLNNRWFKIYPSTMSEDIEYIGYTGTQGWTFQANFMWLKFRYYHSAEVLDPGTMDKIIVRT